MHNNNNNNNNNNNVVFVVVKCLDYPASSVQHRETFITTNVHPTSSPQARAYKN